MRAGDLIKEARRRAGLTQAEAARRAGTSQPAVARYESAASEPSLGTLRRLVRACGLDLRVHLVPRDDHDIELALANLRLTPDERLDQMLAARSFIEEAREAMRTRG